MSYLTRGKQFHESLQNLPSGGASYYNVCAPTGVIRHLADSLAIPDHLNTSVNFPLRKQHWQKICTVLNVNWPIEQT